MEDTIGKFILALRTTTTPRTCALQLCAVAKNSAIDQTVFTETLLQTARSGSLPASTLALWMHITHDILSIVQCMRQQDIEEVCRAAMSSFVLALRNDETSDEAWAAIGGAVGLAALLDTLAVPHVFYMCMMLGRKNPLAVQGRRKRQQVCKDLLAVVCPDKQVAANKRPLQAAYHQLVLACDVETALAWDSRICLRLRKHLRKLHGEAFLAKTLDACFPPSTDAEVSDDDFTCLCDAVKQDRSRYGLAALTRLAESETVPSGLWSGQVVEELIWPVVCRVPSRNSDRQDSATLWKVLTTCFQKHPDLREHLEKVTENSYDRGSESIITQAVRYWRRFGGDADHEASLATLLQLMPEENAAESSVNALVHLAPPRLRYRLLRLFFQHANGFGLDMGPLDENHTTILNTERLHLTLETIFLLPPGDARRLAQRLLISDPEFMWIASSRHNKYNKPRHRNHGSALLHVHHSDDDNGHDTYMLQALLQSVTGITGTLSLEDELLRRQKLSEGSKTPEIRGLWVKSALALSMATGKLDLYSATLSWSKRFARDPLVRYQLCTWHLSGIVELVNLLCVVPSKPLLAFSDYDKAAFTAAVDKANQILVEHVQQTMDATQEPGFDGNEWNNAFDLITEVVHERLARVNIWQDRFSISDADVTELLWTPTLNTLIDAERKLLAFGNEELCRMARLNLYGYGNTPLRRLRMPSSLFLDGLAKARDELWESYRARLDPCVASLKAPWPRGLPLHETVGYAVDAPSTLAYMEERAKSIVFGGSDIYQLPIDAVDSATKLAIGEFMESWPLALNLYIRGAQDEQRQLRIQSAWDHACGSLSKELGLSGNHINVFWLPHFKRAGAKMDEIPTCDEDAIEILPSVDFPLSSPPPAWNPDKAPALLAPESRVVLKPVCLHFFLGNYDFESIPAHIYSSISPPRTYWDLANLPLQKKFSQPAIDGYIGTAAIVLSTQFGSAPLLAEPFPSSRPAEVRFPAMNLDPAFTLDRDNVQEAKSILKKFFKHIPAVFLTRLGSSVLDTLLQSPEMAGNHANNCLQVFVFVSKLLRRKSPVAAADLATRAVLNLSPKKSSWHRSLLSVGLLKWLPASAVEKTMDNLLEGFQLRFGAAELAKKATSGAEDGNKPGAAPVKVTTIKMVAQLLMRTNSVSLEYAVRAVTRLFHTSTHIDVQIAAARTLIRAAETLPDSATAFQQQIIQTLADYVVPQVASLKEGSWRGVATEDEWQSVENRQAPLPELEDDEVFDQGGMLLHTLLKACDSERLLYNPEYAQLRSGLLPLLESALCQNGRLHKRWLKAFIVRENLATWSPEIDVLLPAVPLCFLRQLGVALSCGIVSEDLFQAMSQHLLYVIEPPPALAAITDRISADIKLRKSPAGRHWLHMWTNSSIFWDCNSTWTLTIDTLDSSTPAADADKLMGLARDLAFAFLRTGDASNLDRLVGIFIHWERNALNANDLPASRVRGKGLAIIHQLMSETDRMRSQPSWQQDPDRRPAILPSSFKWEYSIWQCGVPLDTTRMEDQPHVLKSLVDSTVKIVSRLVENPDVPYHLEMQILKNEFHGKGVGITLSPRDFWIQMVIAIGTVNVTGAHSRGGLINCLCADLSSSCLETFRQAGNFNGREETKSPWGEAAPQVNALLDIWKKSDNAFLWERAYDITHK